MAKKQVVTPDLYLRYLAETGLKKRMGLRFVDNAKEFRQRLEFELDVIEKSGFATYFLILADLCNFCRSKQIPIGPGRGSVCGSIMAWAVGITDVNPMLFDIPFERFMHLERIAMPDIDLDVCQRRRQEVIAYLKDKYGSDHVTQIVTFGNLTAKTAITDLCRVLHADQWVYGSGMTNRFGKELSDLIPEGSGADQVYLETFMAENPDFRQKLEAPHMKFDGRKIDVVEHLLTFEGSPRHISKHAAGVIISPQPLMDVLPLRSKNGEDETSQYDMHDLEALGFLKMDCLGLRTVTMLHDIEQMVDGLNFREVPMDDEKTFDLLERGDTVGVFQLEGAGITSATTGLKPRRFEDVFALIALYRPGPMEQLGSFIHRAHGEEEISYIHPDLEPILKDTYGLIVYQEQTMKIAMKFAGLTPGEADMFRKAIGKKIPKLIAEELDKFTVRAIKKKYPKEVVDALAEQIKYFGRYGFNVGHSVGYGYITYWTAYAKANYPLEFFCALLNSYIGNIERIAIILRDAQHHGIKVATPSINSAGLEFVPHPLGDSIIFPLIAIKGMGDKTVATILEDRDQNGTYQGPAGGFEDFCARLPGVPINIKKAMVEAGCFIKPLDKRAELLFCAERRNAELTGKKLQPPDMELANLADWQMAERERKTVGFYLTAHPLKLRMPMLEMYDLSEEIGESGALAGIVTDIHPFESKRGPMAFVSVETLVDGCPDLTMFSDVWAQVKEVIRPGTAILFKYKKQTFRGRTSLVCDVVHEIRQDVFPAGTVTLSIDHVDRGIAKHLRNLVREYEGGSAILKFEIPWWNGKRGLARWTEIGIRPTAAFIEEAKQFGRVILGL